MAFDQIMHFSKHLAGLPLEDAARRLLAIGIPAVDLTVRAKGHVEPEQVEQQLPAIAARLGEVGMKIGMITTNITDPADPVTARILRTASKLGIRYYKLGYYVYNGFGTLRQQRKDVAGKLRELAKINLDLNLHGGFHNHSADSLGATLQDIDFVLEGTDPKALGVYLDPAHATIEGGSCGWEMGMDLLADRITMLAVKDFRWVEGKHRYAGARRHSTEFCPLADGNTPWPQVIQLLKKINFSGPISFHGEYQGGASFADLTTEQVIEQSARDLALFRQWVQAAGETGK